MGYTNKTSHYNLPQWIAGDKPSWLGDVNTAMLNIDTAIAGADASATAAESSAAAANAQVQAQEPKIAKNTTDIQALTEQLADVSGVASAALPKNGGTMTGALTLAGAPTQDLQAATKKYVDDSGIGPVSKYVFNRVLNSEGTGEISPYHPNEFTVRATKSFAVIDFTYRTGTLTSAVAAGSGYYVDLWSFDGNPLNLATKALSEVTTNDELPPIIGIRVSDVVFTTYKHCVYFDGTKTHVGIYKATNDFTEYKSLSVAGNHTVFI